MRQVPIKITDLKRKKQQQEKITVITCYDYSAARIAAACTGLHCVLVGDSVAMVVHGFANTVMATMEMMVLHTEAVARGIREQLIIADLPFLAHRASQAETIANVRRLLHAGAHAIKIEGGDAHTCATIAHLTISGVPVIGHIGLTPQSILQLGSYKVQGKKKEQADQLLQQAQDLAAAGCAALVLECVPEQLAKTITDSLSIPTIGIGAGVHTDGQVLVWHDLLGLQDEVTPKFAKQFTAGKQELLSAVQTYINQVQQRQFPTPAHSFSAEES